MIKLQKFLNLCHQPLARVTIVDDSRKVLFDGFWEDVPKSIPEDNICDISGSVELRLNSNYVKKNGKFVKINKRKGVKDAF